MRSAASQRKQTRTNPIGNAPDYEMGMLEFVIERHELTQQSTCSSSDDQKIFFLGRKRIGESESTCRR
jgi:hypothetical protein